MLKLGLKAAAGTCSGAMDGQRVYLVKRKAVVRVGFEMDSAKAADSVLEKGAEIIALEQRPNADGILRVRF
eukprot:COSAG04_NODE_29187_length_270_cov_1.204678_1_plen_70_part_10